MIYLKLVDPNYKYGCLYICVDSHILILSILLFCAEQSPCQTIQTTATISVHIGIL